MDAVEINVGGVVYTTSLNTLTKYPDSVLYKIVSGSMPCGKDKKGTFCCNISFILLNFEIK